MISYILTFFSNKTNYIKMYDFCKSILNKTNDQTYLKNQPRQQLKYRGVDR
jgi:hypothetical protein